MNHIDNMNDVVEEQLKEIDKMYSEQTYWQRLKKMVVGLKAPRTSKEYKEAVIELQRLGAPATAVILPIVLIGLIMLMDAGQTTQDRVIETEIMEAEEVKDLQDMKDLEKPPEMNQQDVSVDVPSDNVNVQVDTPQNTTMVSPQPQQFDAVQMTKSPVILKNVYGSTRNTGQRGKSLRAFGGDQHTEDAVLRSLRWLKKNQQADGSWKAQKIAMTGLAVLTFLAHGDKPGESQEFGDTVKNALDYLIKQQKADGHFNGVDGNEYAHLIATYALSEAYGMTMNPNVKAAAEKALIPIIKGQHPTGGWDYRMNPNPSDGSHGMKAGEYRDDTSYMGWAVQALKAAKMANIHVEGLEKAYKLAPRGFKKNAAKGGGFGYTSPAKGGLTSVGVLCMMFLGASNEREVRESIELMDEWRPSFSKYSVVKDEMTRVTPAELVPPPTAKPTDAKPSAFEIAKKKLAQKVPEVERKFYTSAPQYYYYYATQCRFHVGGKRWDSWNKEMKPAYITTQEILSKDKSGYTDHKGVAQEIGWWENCDQFTDRPVMDTCLAALQLMVYYRYLPTTSKEAVQVAAEVKTESTDTDDIKVDTGNL